MTHRLTYRLPHRQLTYSHTHISSRISCESTLCGLTMCESICESVSHTCDICELTCMSHTCVYESYVYVWVIYVCMSHTCVYESYMCVWVICVCMSHICVYIYVSCMWVYECVSVWVCKLTRCESTPHISSQISCESTLCELTMMSRSFVIWMYTYILTLIYTHIHLPTYSLTCDVEVICYMDVHTHTNIINICTYVHIHTFPHIVSHVMSRSFVIRIYTHILTL